MSLEMKYFVLKPQAKNNDDVFAKASCAAMFAYADVIEDSDLALATDLRAWASREDARRLREL